MHSEKPQSGVYHYLAEEAFVTALDNLFSGKPLAELDTQDRPKTANKPVDKDDKGQLNLW
jgi:hypothetical protein